MSSPRTSTVKVEFTRTSTEDPRPWAKFVETYRRIGSEVPEHGPWESEPDRAEWIDKASGWPCMAKRGPSGGWCGYVCVPRSHPLYGAPYSHETVEDLVVHGGITFADSWMDEGDWWFGFDCAHAGDLTPGMPTFDIPGDKYPDKYRDLTYVVVNVTALATQLAAMTKEDRQ